MIRRALATVLLVLAVGSASAQSVSDNEPDRRKAAQANAQLALAYLREGDLVTAREKLEKALEQDPNIADTQLAAGFVYDRLGEDDKARSAYEKAVRLSRDNPQVLNSYGSFLCLKGDRKQGEKVLLQAAGSPLNRNPEFAWANAGRCARADGRLKDAESYFRQALARRGDQADMLFSMAEIEHELGNDLQARAFLERYASLAPISAASLWLGYRIERGLGDDDQARLYADRLKREYPMSPEMSALLDAERAGK
ncbi:MAG: type IV pilus biogenesis/stability protein PilW [Steroidobacteraceae bacterium]